jgi:hypothetical protein
MKTELTVVIPVLNSNQHLIADLRQLGQSLIKSSISTEVVIVASSDSLHLTNDQYEEICAKTLLKIRAVTSVPNNNSKSLGRLLRIGNSLADSKYVFFLIPEGKYDSNFLPKALNSCRDGAALVIANRIHDGNTNITGAKVAFAQQRLFSWALRIFGIKLPPDSTNSTRLFEKHFFDALAISGNGWDMLAEQTVKTLLTNGRVETIDVLIPTFDLVGDYKVSFGDRIFGVTRITIRTLLHKIRIPWF